jgi:hypothetical protein
MAGRLLISCVPLRRLPRAAGSPPALHSRRAVSCPCAGSHTVSKRSFSNVVENFNQAHGATKINALEGGNARLLQGGGGKQVRQASPGMVGRGDMHCNGLLLGCPSHRQALHGDAIEFDFTSALPHCNRCVPLLPSHCAHPCSYRRNCTHDVGNVVIVRFGAPGSSRRANVRESSDDDADGDLHQDERT